MTSPIYAALGARIRARRKKLGMTQEDVACVLGVSGSDISYIETGRHGISVDRLLNIADCLRVRPADLLRGL